MTIIVSVLVVVMIYVFMMIRIFYKVLGRFQKIKPADTSDYSGLNQRRQKIKESWLPTVKEEVYHCLSYDQLDLYAKAILRPQGHKWAIIIHGYRGKSDDMIGSAKMFYEHGFHTLRVDCRGHGQSAGKYMGMGWLDRKDILCWIQYILSQDAKADIVLYGVSMGGATVMMSVGENLPSNVKCAIEDCGYTSVRDIFKSQLIKMKVPFVPFVLKTFDFICRLYAHYSIEEASALQQLKKTTIPVLFIHGKEDAFVPCDMVYDNYQACCSEKHYIVYESSGHGMSCLNEKYSDDVFSFIHQYIN